MGPRADQIDHETSKLLAGIHDEKDLRTCYAAVKRRIESLRQAGAEVPEALITAERQLMTEFIAESQGR